MSKFQGNVEKMLRDVFNEGVELTAATLDRAAEITQSSLEEESPVRSGKFKSSWETKQYGNLKRVVGNTAKAQNGIPLINYLEYGKKGKKFVNAAMLKAQSAIKTELNNSGGV